jgi:hypothetical protein
MSMQSFTVCSACYVQLATYGPETRAQLHPEEPRPQSWREAARIQVGKQCSGVVVVVPGVLQ